MTFVIQTQCKHSFPFPPLGTQWHRHQESWQHACGVNIITCSKAFREMQSVIPNCGKFCSLNTVSDSFCSSSLSLSSLLFLLSLSSSLPLPFFFTLFPPISICVHPVCVKYPSRTWLESQSIRWRPSPRGTCFYPSSSFSFWLTSCHTMGLKLEKPSNHKEVALNFSCNHRNLAKGVWVWAGSTQQKGHGRPPAYNRLW